MNSEQVHFNMDSPFKTQLRPLNLLVLINLWNVGQFVLGQNAGYLQMTQSDRRRCLIHAHIIINIIDKHMAHTKQQNWSPAQLFYRGSWLQISLSQSSI